MRRLNCRSICVVFSFLNLEVHTDQPTMEIQGVIFYALMGDHPQAGPRKLRIGIPGTSTTIETFNGILCSTHNIDPLKVKVDVQYFATRETVAPGTVLRNYDELRVVCSRRHLRDVVEEEDRLEQARLRAREQEAEKNVFHMLGETHGASYVASTVHRPSHQLGTDATSSLMRTAAISKRSLPLRLVPLAAAEADGTATACSLCELPLAAASVAPDCCRRTCCQSCLAYARSLLPHDGGCPVCGGGVERAHHPGAARGSHSSTVKEESPNNSVNNSSRPLSTTTMLDPTTVDALQWCLYLRRSAPAGCDDFFRKLRGCIRQSLDEILNTPLGQGGGEGGVRSVGSVRYRAPLKRGRSFVDDDVE